jgi:hypothetical protein
MFTLFNDPFYYRPTYWIQNPWYSRRKSLFERYLDALDQRFFSILTDDAAQLLELENQAKQENPPTTENPKIEAKPADPKIEAKPDDAKTDQKTDEQSVQPKVRSPWYGRQYISHTKTTFNGENYVEEHREKVTGSDGETRIATRRRLGDRWYENETHIDKDGKKSERETWHNVPDEDIEKFKLEWSQNQNCKEKLNCSDTTAKAADTPAPPVTGPTNPNAVEAPTGSSESHE